MNAGSLITLYNENAQGLLHPKETARTFAASLTRRIAQNSGLDAAEKASEGQNAELAQSLANKRDNLQKLESALTGTVSYVTEKFGEKAGTAMMGAVYKSLNEGEITEEALGSAFLEVTRLLDKNFGTDAGDEFISYLNGNLNESLNDYFENGANEEFLVVTSKVGLGDLAKVAAGESSAAEMAKQYTNSILSLLEQAREKAPEDEAELGYGVLAQQKKTGVLMDSMV